MKPLIAPIANALNYHQRVMLALSGPPAAGKSTLSQQIAAHFSEYGCAIVPMDGFHLDNRILKARGQLDEKGAIHSFDAAGFAAIIKKISAEQAVFVPEFDRDLDLSRAGAIEITNQRLIIVEGNYLLHNEPPWSDLLPFWTLSVWVDVSLEMVEARCIKRWLDHGLDPGAARARAQQNDVKNAQNAIQNHLEPDLYYKA